MKISEQSVKEVLKRIEIDLKQVGGDGIASNAFLNKARASISVLLQVIEWEGDDE